MDTQFRGQNLIRRAPTLVWKFFIEIHKGLIVPVSIFNEISQI